MTPSAGSMALVLASGGIDSSAALALATSSFSRVVGLFVDFNQPALDAESSAHRKITSHFGLESRTVRYRGRGVGQGEIRGRNAFFLQTALMEFPLESGAVVIGVHAGTPYRDCSPEFIELMARSFEFHTGGRITISAPFVNLTKSDVFRIAGDADVPLASTHSCEASSRPCGSCDSCVDRAVLLPGERS